MCHDAKVCTKCFLTEATATVVHLQSFYFLHYTLNLNGPSSPADHLQSLATIRRSRTFGGHRGKQRSDLQVNISSVNTS